MNNRSTASTGELIANHFKLSVSLGLIFLVTTLALPVLNEYATDLMLMRVHGNFTITYIYVVLLIYLISWAITLYYTIKTDKMEEEHK